MDEEEKQALLDGLDKRLALGEIDLESYNRLRSKFLHKGTGKSGSDALDKTVDALPREIQKLNCPNCGAPVNAEDDGRESVTCDFCGISYKLKTAEEEMERLRSDLRRWIRSMASSEGGSFSSIDEASRRFIFQDKLLPQINLEASRTVEIFEVTRHQAVIDVPLSRVTPNTPFKQTLVATPVIEDFRERIAEIMSKVQSEEIGKFALDPADEKKLWILRLKCQELIYLHNIRNKFRSISGDSLKYAVKNLTALGKLYSSGIERFEKDSPDRAFYTSLKRRMDALKEATEIMFGLLYRMETRDLSQSAGKLVEIRGKLESLIGDVNSSGKEHREIIPLIEGIKADIGSLDVLVSSIDLYTTSFGGDDNGYPDFLNDLESMISESPDRSGGINWLLNFITILGSHIGTVHRKRKVPVVKDVSWVKEMIRDNIRSSFLGGKETAEIETRFFLPFWAAAVSFSKQKGFFFKQGFSDKGLLLLPAVNGSHDPIRIEDESPLYRKCLGSFLRPGIVGKSHFSFCPMIDEVTAMKKLEMFKNGSMALQSGYLKMLGIIYLPAVLVRFTRKGERRMTLLGDASLYMDYTPLRKVRIGGIDLFVSR